jgi:hypothetical protein
MSVKVSSVRISLPGQKRMPCQLGENNAAFIFAASYLGLAFGEKSGPENNALIAAVIVDPTALNNGDRKSIMLL